MAEDVSQLAASKTEADLRAANAQLEAALARLRQINDDLTRKLDGMSRTHSDLLNLMTATDLATIFLDPSLRIKRMTPRLAQLFGLAAADEGRPIADFAHRFEFHKLSEHAHAVLSDLTPSQHEVRGHDGNWYLVRLRPYRTVDEKVDGVVATFVDVSESRRAEDALRASENQLRQETRLVELSRAPIFVWDFDGGIVQWNRGSEVLYGYTRDEVLGRDKRVLLQTEVPGSSFEALRASLLDSGSWSGEVLHRTKDGRVLTVESELELVPQGDRRLVLESTRDVTEQKRWELRRQLLLTELSHRVRNTLTVVQAVARQTLHSADSDADFVERFEGRLTALAQSHKILVDKHWEGADLAALARSQLAAHAREAGHRLTIQGQPVTLPPDLATPFGLVLHELATNAAKYGALSVQTGSVSLHWTFGIGNDRRLLRVVWEERGGPPVEVPKRKGFGSVLIERGLPGATVARDFTPEGLVCTIELTVPEVEQREQPA